MTISSRQKREKISNSCDPVGEAKQIRRSQRQKKKTRGLATGGTAGGVATTHSKFCRKRKKEQAGKKGLVVMVRLDIATAGGGSARQRRKRKNHGQKRKVGTSAHQVSSAVKRPGGPPSEKRGRGKKQRQGQRHRSGSRKRGQHQPDPIEGAQKKKPFIKGIR